MFKTIYKTGLKLGVIYLFLLSAIVVYFYLRYPFLGNDDGFYLSVIRELKAGKTYFTEIGISYNPLAIFIMGIPSFIFNYSSSQGALIINFLAFIGVTLIFYKIARSFSIEKSLALLFSFLLFLYLLFLDGGYVMLEPITLLFQISSLGLFLKYTKGLKRVHLVLSGVLLGLGFLSKQYALFLLLPFFYYFIINRKIKAAIYFSIGAIFPVVILASFYVFKGVHINQFVAYLLGYGVEIDQGHGTGYARKIVNIKRIKEYAFINAVFLIIPYILYKVKIKNQINIFYVLLPISSLSILYFADYKHYFQLIIPFFMICLVYLISKYTIILKSKFFIVFLLVSILSLTFYSRKNVLTREVYYEWQQEDAKVVKKIIEKNSTVYLSGLSPAYYHIGIYKSISLSKIGYGFPGAFYPETIISLLKKDEYLVLNSEYEEKYSSFMDLFYLKKRVNLKFGDYYILKKK